MAPFVGLTGGLGAGKSEALRLLGELGAATLSTDAVVHELLARRAARRARRAARPRGRRPTARLDRARIAERVFGDDEARAWLEGLLWPRVGERVAAWRAEVGRRSAVAVVEVPLLFESGMEAVFDSTIAVIADEPLREQRAARARARGGRRARRTAAVAAGKGGQSGLHGAQRWLPRGVEADAVPRTCQTRTARELPRCPLRPPPAASAQSGGDAWRSWRSLPCSARRSPGVVTGAGPLGDAVREITLPLRHDDIIRQQASDKELDPALIAAVIYEESRFRDQTSHAGARGLMQITPATADFIARRSGGIRFEQADLATPQINIAYGAWYLRYLIDHYDGQRDARGRRLQRGPDQRGPLGRAGRRPGRVRQRPPHPVPGDARVRGERAWSAAAQYRDHYGDELGL